MAGAFRNVYGQEIELTGEQTACMRDRETGKLHELMVIRSSQDMQQFAKEYGIDLDAVRTVY